MKSIPTLTKKQFEMQLAAITRAAVRPASKGARVQVAVTSGRPHRVQIRVMAVPRHRQAVLDLLRPGRTWMQALLAVWPCNVFVAIEPPDRPRLLEGGQIAFDLQMTGVNIAP
jgi:hypothetical protein